jgi:hypothetical protein
MQQALCQFFNLLKSLLFHIFLNRNQNSQFSSFEKKESGIPPSAVSVHRHQRNWLNEACISGFFLHKIQTLVLTMILWRHLIVNLGNPGISLAIPGGAGTRNNGSETGG